MTLQVVHSELEGAAALLDRAGAMVRDGRSRLPGGVLAAVPDAFGVSEVLWSFHAAVQADLDWTTQVLAALAGRVRTASAGVARVDAAPVGGAA